MKDLRKYQLNNGIARVFFVQNQLVVFLTRCCSLFASFKHMFLARLVAQLGMGLSAFCFSITLQAGMPVWSITPDPGFPPVTSVSSTTFAQVKYNVTNNSSRAHNLVIVPQTGVSQNGACFLAPKGSCVLTLTIIGSALPASGLSGGPVLCSTSDGTTPNPNQCYQPYSTDHLAITMVPNRLSMQPIPIQEATANQFFVYNLKSAVTFYEENLNAGFPAQAIVSPAEQDGLRFDSSSFSITGTPKRTGTYLFKVGVQNAYGTSEFIDFAVQAQANAKDKPVFKQHYSMASALPAQKYSMNLMELVEHQTGFMHTNQISFRIDTQLSHPDWLDIASDDSSRLEGKVPSEAAGKEAELTLIASSNTGGDSLPLTIKIPIAYDPAQKPVINSFELEQLAGSNMYEDLSSYIDDPAHDSNLKLILDKVEPAAPWLSISSLNPTVLEGTVPDEATGQQFQLTLRASSAIGGSSEPIVIPLQISIDPKQTPRFKAAKPLMPILYRNQSFSYDFVAANDIYPEFNDAPYLIAFAKDFNPLGWLRLEGNKLISDRVPDVPDDVEIKIVIKNTPGGASEEYLLSLISMG